MNGMNNISAYCNMGFNGIGGYANYGMNFGYNSMNSMLGNMFSGYSMPGMGSYGYGMPGMNMGNGMSGMGNMNMGYGMPGMGGGYGNMGNYGGYMGMNGSMSLPIYNYQQGQAWDTTLATNLGRRDPVYLDTNHDGQLNVQSGQHVAFDMNGDGVMDDVTEWDTQDAQLVYNQIGPNGQIDGKELMDTTGLDGTQNKYKTGWDKAADVFGADSNGIISGDALKNVRLWTDSNGDGKVEDGELKTADQMGITSIDTKSGTFTYANQVGQMNMNYNVNYGNNPYGNQMNPYGGSQMGMGSYGMNPYGGMMGGMSGYNPYGSQMGNYGMMGGMSGMGGFNPYGSMMGGYPMMGGMGGYNQMGYNPMMSMMGNPYGMNMNMNMNYDPTQAQAMQQMQMPQQSGGMQANDPKLAALREVFESKVNSHERGSQNYQLPEQTLEQIGGFSSDVASKLAKAYIVDGTNLSVQLLVSSGVSQQEAQQIMSLY